jgi:hypothetical protein
MAGWGARPRPLARCAGTVGNADADPPAEQLDDRAAPLILAGLAAGRELEHHGDRELVQLIAQFPEGRVVSVVQRVKRLLAPFPVIRGLDDDPGEELPRLDFRCITVPKHRDLPDRALREPAAHLLVELLPYLVKLGLFHDRLREFRV